MDPITEIPVYTSKVNSYDAAVYTAKKGITADEWNALWLAQVYQGNYQDTILKLIMEDLLPTQVTAINQLINNADNVDLALADINTALDTKVDKVLGKGLSTNDFTDYYKERLETLDSDNLYYKGYYPSYAALVAAIPTGSAGYFAYVDGGAGEIVQKYIWDTSDVAWVTGGGDIGSLDYLDFNNILASYAERRISWNDAEGTFDMHLKNNVILQTGQEMLIFGKASEDILNGQVVMFDGAQGSFIKLKVADQSLPDYSSAKILGVATQDIATNAFGYIAFFGKVRDVDTYAYEEGDILYFDGIGGWTTTEPTDTNYPRVSIGTVLKKSTSAVANNGIIGVRVNSDHIVRRIQNEDNTSYIDAKYKTINFPDEAGLMLIKTKRQYGATDYSEITFRNTQGGLASAVDYASIINKNTLGTESYKFTANSGDEPDTVARLKNIQHEYEYSVIIAPDDWTLVAGVYVATKTVTGITDSMNPKLILDTSGATSLTNADELRVEFAKINDGDTAADTVVFKALAAPLLSLTIFLTGVA